MSQICWEMVVKVGIQLPKEDKRGNPVIMDIGQFVHAASFAENVTPEPIRAAMRTADVVVNVRVGVMGVKLKIVLPALRSASIL